MTSELYISSSPKKISIALTEDKRLVEYQEEAQEASFNVGNIYVAKVRKLMPGLNASFINVGHEKDAFIHYLDLGTKFLTMDKFTREVRNSKRVVPLGKMKAEAELGKEGAIQNTLKQGQEVMVQIVKEPINTKGPRLSAEISFPGRFLVLVPLGDKVSVSSKIKSGTERARLKQIIESIKPKGFGVIVRTVAEGKKAGELDQEMKVLTNRWEEAIGRMAKAKQLPAMIYEEESRAVGMLRDLFNPSYENIYVDDENIFREVKDYVTLIAPERAQIVKLYRGKLPIFDNFDITRQIKASFGKTVSYKHGAYLVIEHTEALHVVDVNSGNRSKNKDGQEANALEVNLGAADELARQLRLRDMGGIIVVDFIDMHLAEDRKALLDRMTENMKSDRARHNILPLSKFGLMQITRQRVRPATNVNVDETCPTCHGKGTIKSSYLFTDVLGEKIEEVLGRCGLKKTTLRVHPYVYAYINQGLLSIKRKWKFKYGNRLQVVPSQMLGFLEYEFYDDNDSLFELESSAL